MNKEIQKKQNQMKDKLMQNLKVKNKKLQHQIQNILNQIQLKIQNFVETLKKHKILNFVIQQLNKLLKNHQQNKEKAHSE